MSRGLPVLLLVILSGCSTSAFHITVHGTGSLVKSCIKSQDQRRLPSQQRKNIVCIDFQTASATFTRRALLGSSLFLLTKSVPSQAKAGEAAKFKGIGDFASDVMGCQDERTNGCRDGRTDKSLYDLESQKIMQERAVKVGKEWAKLKAQVDVALSQQDCGRARDALGLRLGTIKPQMREIARLASGGDVFVRPEAGAPAVFDFKSGAFELKEVARLPEDTFAAINRLDDMCKLKDPAGAAAQWEQAKAAFDQWFGILSGSQ